MSLLRDYAASVAQPTLGEFGTTHATRYDEVVGPDGSLRSAWKPLAEIASVLTAEDLRRVSGDIGRFLADDGVSYSRPGESGGTWRLDPVPLIIGADDWHPLEVGLAQRAELLNAVLADLYGEQKLLSDGVIPAAVIFGHPGFSRVAARNSMREARPLVVSATDLGRDATGEWRVLADWTQAPSGLGFAMENRRVISRVIPELYRASGLHRMEPYFWALRSSLMQSAPGDLADPRIVVLSPGTHSETAYDQAYVASMLGFPLVQGSDLTVRDGIVYLRTPTGFDRVDVIMRRVDADWSDPLELRGDSQLGVAGLVEASRRGNVRVVNGFGAGVLENPGLVPYLPAACELLLGESLRLQSTPTWWCGDDTQRAHVLDHLHDLRLRTLDGKPVTVPYGESDLDAALREAILDEPWKYVAQELPQLSQAPVWDAYAGAVARPITLRTFTLRYGSAYRTLSGGMASIRADDFHAACSKDVWVLKESPEAADQGLADVLPLTNAHTTPVVVPRALEDLYWAGRYAERAEDLLRLVLVAHARSEDFRTRPWSSGGTSLSVLMSALARLAGPGVEGFDEEFRSLLGDESRYGSAAQSLASLREALEGVRDQLSNDTWRAFSMTDRAVEQLGAHRHSHQIAESAGQMLIGALSLQGVTASMVRDPGWHINRTGQLLERAMQLCLLLRSTSTQRRGIDVDREVLSSVLQATESSVTHRRRYRGYVRTAGVLELLLTDADNPRSLLFCLTQVRVHLEGLPASTGSSRPERLLDDIVELLDQTEIATLVTIGGVSRPNLETFLDHVMSQLGRLSDAITQVHLATGPAPRPLNEFALHEALEGEVAG